MIFIYGSYINEYVFGKIWGRFRQNTMGMGYSFVDCGSPVEVNSDDECPICHYGIDLSQDAWVNYHDMHSAAWRCQWMCQAPGGKHKQILNCL